MRDRRTSPVFLSDDARTHSIPPPQVLLK